MICRVVEDVLFCEECAPRANVMLSAGMVGQRSLFAKACPHVEIAFLKWHEAQKAKEPTAFRHVWQPFCIGLMLGWSVACVVWGAT